MVRIGDQHFWLGLGQVLRYRHRLRRLGNERVVPVLVPGRTPRDRSWGDLCQELGVALLGGNEIERAPTLVGAADVSQIK